MKTKIRSILFSLLCLVLVVGLLPTTAYAVSVIGSVDVSLAYPEADKTPPSYATINGYGYTFYDIEWYDESDQRFLYTGDLIKAGHRYSATIWVEANDGYEFNSKNDNTPNITGYVNGEQVTVVKAYEYKAWAMVCLIYYFSVPEKTEPEHTHTPSEWRTNQVYHYQVCTTCGDMLVDEDHTGGTATCVEKGICSICGYAYLDVTEDHVPDTSKWIARAEMYHYHACKLCNAHCDIEEHLWSPRYHEVNEKGHAYQCAHCKGYDIIYPHNPGPEATETTPQTCKDCGYIIAPAINHTHELRRAEAVAPTCTEPGNIEYYICDGCSCFFSDSEGSIKITDTAIAPLGHQLSEDWKHDENHHWRTCTVCNEVLIETKLTHEMESGKCTTCNYSEAEPENTPSDPTETTPTETPPTETTPNPTVTQPEEDINNGMPWWVILLIGLGSIVVGIAVGVLVLKHKKAKS